MVENFTIKFPTSYFELLRIKPPNWRRHQTVCQIKLIEEDIAFCFWKTLLILLIFFFILLALISVDETKITLVDMIHSYEKYILLACMAAKHHTCGFKLQQHDCCISLGHCKISPKLCYVSQGSTL